MEYCKIFATFTAVYSYPFHINQPYNFHKTFPLADLFKFFKRWSTLDVYASRKATEKKLLWHICGCSGKRCFATEPQHLENGLTFKSVNFCSFHTHSPILPQKVLLYPTKYSFVWCWTKMYLLETSKSTSLLNNTYHFQKRLSSINLQHCDVCLVNHKHILHQGQVPQLLTLNRQLTGGNACTR